MHGGAIPTSTARLLVFVGLRQPVIIRQVTFMGDSIINWIEQWLTDRRQRVVVDGEVSKIHQEKSSEVIFPVLEHAKLHFGTGRDSVREIMIKHPN